MDDEADVWLRDQIEQMLSECQRCLWRDACWLYQQVREVARLVLPEFYAEDAIHEFVSNGPVGIPHLN